jgi:two-component system, OmpR family, response regulator
MAGLAPRTPGGGSRAEPAPAGRVLVVDDEEHISDLISTALRYEGFETSRCGSGREALRAVQAFRPDLVVLDVMLPDLDGVEVGRRLRAAGDPIPIIFLTARDSTEDKIRGLSAGGDDYVTKPFSLEELVLRIRSVLRRTSGARPNEQLRCADLVLDEDTHEVRRGGRRLDLTATEFRLLVYLLSNQRRVVSKSQIIDNVWSYDFGGDANVVETYISYLRRKIDREGPPLIHTVRGVGYVLRPPEP